MRALLLFCYFFLPAVFSKSHAQPLLYFPFEPCAASILLWPLLVGYGVKTSKKCRNRKSVENLYLGFFLCILSCADALRGRLRYEGVHGWNVHWPSYCGNDPTLWNDGDASSKVEDEDGRGRGRWRGASSVGESGVRRLR